jgi:hypothetical protein
MEFKMDEYDRLEKQDLVVDLRDQLQAAIDVYEDLRRELDAYNELVAKAERFVNRIIEETEDSLEGRTDRFQASKRGQEIQMWIRELSEFIIPAKKIQFPEIPELDPDYEGVATQLEDLSEEA